MGWSFYELSGGADYTPRTNSIQARALLDDVRPMARPVRTHIAQLSGTGDVAPAVEPVAQDTAPRKAAPGIEPGPQTLVTLASANADTLAAPVTGLPVITAQPAEAAVTAAVAQTEIAGLTLRGLSDPIRLDTEPTDPPDDIRTIAGTAVNMRAGPGTQYDRIARLTRGDEVAALQDPGNGWLKLRVVETGRVGWMAGGLVAASAN
ncbi:SH3 domain-containing protein [Roseovarius sp.]